MKKIFTLIMTLAMAMSLAACGNKENKEQSDTPSYEVQLVNPFESCDTMEDAEELAGFSMEVDTEFVADTNIFRASKDQMIEVIGMEDEEAIIRIRKGKGNQDISGDYTEYNRVEEQVLNGQPMTVKGNGNLIHVVTWNADDYSYAVTSEAGIQKDLLTAVLITIY